MLMRKSWPYTVLFFLSLVFFTRCKRNEDKPGCMDGAAINYDAMATIKMSTCIYVYPWIIRNPSFEMSYVLWDPEVSNGHSTDVYFKSTPDGIMPTNGQCYLQCIPHVGKFTSVLQGDVGPNLHFKGFYFDYRYKAKVDINGEISASAYVESWSKIINETSLSLGGVDSVIVEKRDEFSPMSKYNGTTYIPIQCYVTKGTFTFEIDNIRMVQD